MMRNAGNDDLAGCEKRMVVPADLLLGEWIKTGTLYVSALTTDSVVMKLSNLDARWP